jgi:adenosylcobinamide kinase / adenosylcobinamide-phosphate guanylyltransferase
VKVEAVDTGCWLIDDTIALRTVDDAPAQPREHVVGPLRPGEHAAVGRYTVVADPDGRHYDIHSDLGHRIRVSVPDREPVTTLVLGGARSGKSREAERRLAGSDNVVYAATAALDEHDREWQSRIDEHRLRRHPGWRTIEFPDLVALLDDPGPPLLVDCVTLWLTRVMDEAHAWDDGAWDHAQVLVRGRIDETLNALGRPRQPATNEVGSGIVPDTSAGRRFRDLLGQLNASMAAASDEVLLCVAGRVVTL